ncbi:MAG: HD-GYP domain-containing protein [Lachnoclostridium sp.]|jgi:HD-GYP domain-containing protein (c-di-GMP phosphodiesterase class II)
MFSLEETYNQAIKISRNLIEDIRFGRKLYLDPVKICSTQICKFVNEDNQILTFLNSVQDKNPYMYSHPVNVAFLSLVISKWLDLDNTILEKLVRAGFLLDIGKAKIKDSLLNKTGMLTLEETEKLKSHPVVGYKILEKLNTCEPEVLQGILLHHERMDGTGYPFGLKGDKINLFSKIIAIADTFDAITATKTYSKKNSPLKALEVIQANSLHNLDPDICNIFIKNIIKHYTGRGILLNDNQIGKIVYINKANITRPVVCCDKENIDLSENSDIDIAKFL